MNLGWEQNFSRAVNATDDHHSMTIKVKDRWTLIRLVDQRDKIIYVVFNCQNWAASPFPS